MYKRIGAILAIFLLLFSYTAKATTIIGIIGEHEITFAADTRSTRTDRYGRILYEDNIHKVYKLKNNVGVAFAGNTGNLMTLESGRQVTVRDVKNIIDDVNNIKDIKDFTLRETVELLGNKYVQMLQGFQGNMLIAGLDEKNEPILYVGMIKNGEFKAKPIGGKGSFSIIGSGSKIATECLLKRCNFSSQEDLKELVNEYIPNLSNREIRNLAQKSVEDTVEIYKTYEYTKQTTGGVVTLLTIKDNNVIRKGKTIIGIN